jgi:hypothetical protein
MINYLKRFNNDIVMVNIVLIEKTGELKICKYNSEKGDELYKKCKFKKLDGFEERHTWNNKKDKYSFASVTLYARDNGKANTENKYEMPPPVDNILYFGTCALLAKDEDGIDVDLDVETWNTFYEELYGGFENLADTAKEDEEEEDELESIPAEMKTKSGYLKDDFVVDDNHLEEGESEGEYSDEMSELEYEDYSYSDDE